MIAQAPDFDTPDTRHPVPMPGQTGDHRCTHKCREALEIDTHQAIILPLGKKHE
jgi:ribosomal protein L3